MGRKVATESELNHHPIELLEQSETNGVDLLAYMMIRVSLVGSLLGGAYLFLVQLLWLSGIPKLEDSQAFARTSGTATVTLLCVGAVFGSLFGLILGLITGMITGFLLFAVTRIFIIQGRTQSYSITSTILCMIIVLPSAFFAFYELTISYYTHLNIPPLDFILGIVLPTIIAVAATGWVVWRKTSAIERGTDRPKRKKKIDKEVQA